jgi:hypothetical protein
MRLLPNSLLVRGDVVEMFYGDTAPAKATCTLPSRESAAESGSSSESYQIEVNQVFRPSLFGADPTPLVRKESLARKGRFHFVLDETSAVATVQSALGHQRPDSTMANQIQRVRKIIYHYIVWVLLGISLGANAFRLAMDAERSSTWFMYMFINQAYAILPCVPIVSGWLWVLLRTFGNSKVLALFEQLQQSKTPFDDDIGVDAFDEEAPPPTKDIYLSTGKNVYFTFIFNYFRNAAASVLEHDLAGKVLHAHAFDGYSRIARIHHRHLQH